MLNNCALILSKNIFSGNVRGISTRMASTEIEQKVFLMEFTTFYFSHTTKHEKRNVKQSRFTQFLT